MHDNLLSYRQYKKWIKNVMPNELVKFCIAHHSILSTGRDKIFSSALLLYVKCLI